MLILTSAPMMRCAAGGLLGGAQLRVSDPASDPAGRAFLCAACGAAGVIRTSHRKGLAVADNVVLIMRFHPVGGEDVSVISQDFAGEHEALEAVSRALNEQRSLVLRHARYNREADENGVIINLANVVSVRVSRTDSAATGQYL